jgi:hypothetical protein
VATLPVVTKQNYPVSLSSHAVGSEHELSPNFGDGVTDQAAA